MRTFNKRMESLLERKTNFNDDLQNFVYAKAELDMTMEKQVSIESQLSFVRSQFQELEQLLKDVPEDLQVQMDYIAAVIQYTELQSDLDKLQSQFDQIQQDETQERESQREQLEHVLWKHRGRQKDLQTATSEIESYQEQQNTWKQYQNAWNKLEDLQEELELEPMDKDAMIDYYNKLVENIVEERAELYGTKEQLVIAAEKLAFEKELVTCPECEAHLRWQDNALVSVHDHQPVEERDYDQEIAATEKQIKKSNKLKTKYERDLQRVKEIIIPSIQKTDPQVYKQMDHQIHMLSMYITQNKQREEDLARIERESAKNYLSPALKGLRKQIDAIEDEMGDLLEIIGDEPTEELQTLREKLQDLSNQFKHYQTHADKMEEVTAELEELQQKNTDLNSQIQLLKQKNSGVNIEAIKKKITGVDRNIAKAKRKQTEDEELSDKVDQYLVYCEQQKELDRWEEQLAGITKELKNAERVHTATLTLKDKYVQAEIVALESTISSINEHTRYYLDTFFADHQLSAKLEAAHKGKKIQTLKIDTAINYKGNEYDNISQMSGGEFDRCTLASICGINSMLGSPILILDESLASLDADNNTEIIRFLSELAEDKLILVCSHEAVRGIFDDIIEL